MHHASYAEPRLLQPASSNEADGYVIAGFTPQDAPDIPRAFTAVYGRDYLSSVVYSPDAFAALIASGAQISFIARDAAGDIAGHIALAFSAPNHGLVELCQGIVTPDHRKRSEEHTSELQSLMRLSYAVFRLKNKTYKHNQNPQR